jgi:hypothetical protein
MFKKGLCLPSSANLIFADQQKIAAVFVEELIKTFGSTLKLVGI